MSIAVDSSRTAALARASCLDTCAQIYLNEGRSAQALPVEEEALAIRQKICGRDHPSTGESLMTLAVIYIAQKDYSSAKVCLEQAIAIAQDRFGQDSAKLAKVLAIQGTCAQRAGAADKAKEIFGKASTITSKLSDIDNPQVKNLRGLIPGTDTGQAFWQTGKKSDSSFAIDPMARCITSLFSKGTIEPPETPKEPPTVLQTVVNEPPAKGSAASQAAPTSQDSINSGLKKIKVDRTFLWMAGIIVIPIIVLVVFSVFGNFFRSFRGSARRAERRGPGKETSQNNAENQPANKDSSNPMMSRYVDDDKVNKMWDINQ
jgi:tetratricopeptide (TPR) repeat protein